MSRSVSQRIPSGPRKSSDFKDVNEREGESPGSQGKLSDAPGMLGQSDPSGFYAGPTSTLSHLIAVSDAVAPCDYMGLNVRALVLDP